MSGTQSRPALAFALGGLLAAAAVPSLAQCPSRLGDVAPGAIDTSTVPPTYRVAGDGVINIADVVVVMRAAVGTQTVAWAADATCPQFLGDVAPGWLDDSTIPPTWLPIGNREHDLGDVIVLLRASVGIQRVSSTLTYYRDAKVILDDRCGSCHVSGGLAPFSLEGWANVQPQAFSIFPMVEQRLMPPWPPADSCARLMGSRALTEPDRATLLSWIAQGAAEGRPTDEPPPRVQPPAITYDTQMTIVDPYTPNTSVSDDYRCFVLPWTAPARVYATGFRALPDVDPIVHHVIAYAVDAVNVPEFQALDDAEAGEGYTCYGGPKGPDGAARWVGAWAPGGNGGAFPDDTGIRIDPGSVIILQVHYNTDHAAAAPDQTSIELRTAPTVTLPAVVALWPGDSFYIPAGSPDYQYEETWSGIASMTLEDRAELGISLLQPYVIRDVALHAHQLGTSLQLELEQSSGGTDCLLDIPEWDFHWQGVYRLETPMSVGQSDIIHVRCQWDNTAENQAYVGGVQQAPADVQWGENSRDEMCLGLAYVTAR